jgi:excisionase family DNA binding protein
MQTDHRHLPPLDANQRYTIDEAAAFLRISRVHLYANVKAGKLRLLKDGRRSFIPGAQIVAASQV